MPIYLNALVLLLHAVLGISALAQLFIMSAIVLCKDFSFSFKPRAPNASVSALTRRRL